MKRLIVCCDGTWNDLEMRYITNVGRLVQALEPEAKQNGANIRQLIYYDDGVGAESSGVRRLVEGALGRGIDTIIYEAYRFICINYEPGDEVCLFGFSRGAFTVRSIAGMINRVGLVPRSQLKHVPEALTSYRSKSEKEQADFKRDSKARDIEIALLGCWDTVGALGIPDKTSLLSIDKLSRKKYEFHDLTLATNVKRAIHALAIDEQREEFEATLMHKSRQNQKLVQRWFPGDHGCVGGGLWEKRGLSNHCLRWMIEEAAGLGVKIGVDWNVLHDQALVDPSIFFDNDVGVIYSRKPRRLRASTVKFSDLDETVLHRWAEDGKYRSSNLSRFKTQLDNAAKNRKNVRVPPKPTAHLGVGDSAFVQVFARESDNRTGIEVAQGERYEIEVARTQVWKDGDLDPCDINGWNTIPPDKKGSKVPWEDGERVDHNALSARLIRLGRKKRLVQGADWFQLVVGIDGDDFTAPAVVTPADETAPYTLRYQAPGDGRLSFAANDLQSRIGLIDKYDNNTGWVWAKVTRKA